MVHPFQPRPFDCPSLLSGGPFISWGYVQMQLHHFSASGSLLPTFLYRVLCPGDFDSHDLHLMVLRCNLLAELRSRCTAGRFLPLAVPSQLFPCHDLLSFSSRVEILFFFPTSLILGWGVLCFSSIFSFTFFSFSYSV